MAILVARGAGFIESYICDYLVEKNLEVICLDTLKNGGYRINIQHLLKNKNFKLIRNDITDPIKLDEGISEVYYVERQRDSLENKLDSIKRLGNVINFAVEKKAKLLFASSYNQYFGSAKKQNITGNEKLGCIDTSSFTDRGSSFGETLVVSYIQENRLDGRIARAFNVHGPLMRFADWEMITEFFVNALKNEQITVYGDGSHKMNFCYVRDVVDGLFKVMESEHKMPVNLIGNEGCTVSDLARKIKKMSNLQPKMVFNKELEVYNFWNGNNLKNLDGWEPKFDLERGLYSTLYWFKTFLMNWFPLLDCDQ